MHKHEASHVWPKLAEESSWWTRLLWVFRAGRHKPVRRSSYVAPE